ncbi:MAG: c-type cytochrome [Chlamydiota bacterium]
MRGELYQIVLISLGIIIAALFGAFLYRELFPEYKIYQNDYVELEKFRSSYTGEAPPSFKAGVKQIVIERKDKGPSQVERCTSCHVALEFEHFSPTKIAYDINGNMITGPDGFPQKVKNDQYVWGKLEEKVAELRNEKRNNELIGDGKQSEVNRRLAEADRLVSLKTAKVGDHTYDVTKVLAMHPLIGRETRPFEFHPIEEYGCIACHSGNERGLTTEKAHGPVFDGKYEAEFMGPTPKFLESDPDNDPKFATIFNHKPGHSLLFQTTPILVGALIEAKCVQCHDSSSAVFESAYHMTKIPLEQRKAKHDAVIASYNTEVQALATLLRIKASIKKNGYQKTLEALETKVKDFSIQPEELNAINFQVKFLRRNQQSPKKGEEQINQQIFAMIGSPDLVEELLNLLKSKKQSLNQNIKSFVKEHRESKQATGSLFAKADAANLETALIQHVRDTKQSFRKTVDDQQTVSAMVTDVDLLTQNFQNGERLFISQACYACHRIAGLSRGGVGPELTEEGNKYPWFIKESMVWPQADLKTSTMPNFYLDHQELESLMTYLLAQKGQKKNVSDTSHKIAIQDWEAGKKMPWEEPISPAKMHNVDYAMEVFATEGCAACHRLKGFDSDVGFAVEKQKEVSFDELYNEQEWFSSLFPEEVPGSQIVDVIENNSEEIDRRIVSGVRSDSILEKISNKHPGAIEGLYSNFRFASRAKNHYYDNLVSETSDPKQKKHYEKLKQEWIDRVNRVLMIYIQEYGLGRLVGPKPNWAGVYRTDEWLIEHFKNPSSHIARSIMPVFPFDTSKFYALTYMLDVLGIRNRDQLRKIWEERGFNPKQAYDVLCSQCHGEFLQGNGPVSEWIYPIPKSLRNADFLRNLTREKAYESIIHGVKGTPMPPWGEVGSDKPTADGQPVLTQGETVQIVDWIYSSLPGGTVIRTSEEVPKWQYTPEKIIEELKKEGNILEGHPEPPSQKEQEEAVAPELTALPKGDQYYVDINPKVYTNQVENEKPPAPNISEYFDVKEHPVGDTEESGYYIKKRFYTTKNLQAGKAYFELNCAVCHGREADGAGARAGAMVDAKPRMLTNLDWLDTRDDLRLIRSIKYGVTGTSMTPWGDQTSSLQRMQLVMHIRTLSEEAKLRDQLFSSLYRAFNQSEIVIENVRIIEFPKLAEVQNLLDASKRTRRQLHTAVNQGITSPDEAVKEYQRQLQLTQKLNELETVDQTLQDLINEIKKERDLMLDLGLTIISQRRNGTVTENYYKLIHLQEGLYSLNDDHLSFKEAPEIDIAAAGEKISAEVSATIQKLSLEKVQEQGKIRSPQTEETIRSLDQQIGSLQDLRNKVTSTLEQAKRSRLRQRKLVEEFNRQSQELEAA